MTRTFQLHRDHDVSGISGTGVVADGHVFPDGVTVIRWRGERQSTVVWPSVEDVEAIHGHGGATRIVWTDDALSVPAPGRDDHEVLAKVAADAWNSVSTLHCTSGSIGPRAVADAILAAGFRRLTVTPEMVEAGAKALSEIWAMRSGSTDRRPTDLDRQECHAVLEATLGGAK